MTSNLISLILDGLVAILLIVCISFCIKLHNRIKLLHDNRKDFSKGIKHFDDAILRAENSLHELKLISSTVVVDLKGTIDKAEHTIKDLSFITDRADNLSNKLESGITAARTVLTSPAMQLLVREDRQHGVKAPMPALKESDNSRAASLQSLLERISAAKDTHQKRATSSSFEPTAPKKMATLPAPNASSSFLRTLRTLSRGDNT